MSEDLEVLLNERHIGKIAGVYNSCFNVLMEEGMFTTFFSSRKGMTPSSVITDMPDDTSFIEMGIASGMEAIIDNAQMIMPDTDFSCDLSKVGIIKLRNEITLPLLSENQIRRNIFILNAGLKGITQRNGACVYIDQWQSFLDGSLKINAKWPLDMSFFNKLKQLLQTVGLKDINKMKDSLFRFIGSGIGLTPSADDIVLGLTAWLYYDSPSEWQPWFKALAEFIELHGKVRTTLVSDHYLRFGAKGIFSDLLNQMIIALLFSRDKKKIHNAVKNMLAYGLSSGAEICMGIIAGYTISMRANTRVQDLN